MSNSFATSWTVARQVPLSMEFSRQEYSSGLPFSSPGDLPNPGMEPGSPALAGGFFTTSATWEAPHEVRDVILPGIEPQIASGLCVLSCFSCVQLCDPMD